MDARNTESGVQMGRQELGSGVWTTPLGQVLRYGVAPLAIATLVCLLVGRSDAFVQLVSRYRPESVETGMHTRSEMQMLHLEAERRAGGTEPLVVFMGSSSVYNGIDPAEIEPIWKQAGVRLTPRNYGLTVFAAYELPLLADEVLRDDVKAVVFLYSTFSFADRVHPDTVLSRWDTGAYLDAYGVGRLPWYESGSVVGGALGEMLLPVRYQSVLRTVAYRALTGAAKEWEWPYDYPPDDPVRDWGQPELEPPAPPTTWDRVAVLDSQTGRETLGHLGLRRFLEMAADRGIRVVVAPVPEPEIQQYSAYWRGASRERLDALVEPIVLEGKGQWIPRAETAFIERRPELFRDDAHLHVEGRREYSVWLAERLLPLLPRER